MVEGEEDPGIPYERLGDIYFMVLLLMAEILHHLGCIKPCK